MSNRVIGYWMGQRPTEPVALIVRDEKGYQMNLANYESFELQMIGTDNEEVDVSDVEFVTAGANVGRFQIRWPATRTIFDKPGEYLLQVRMHGEGGQLDMLNPLIVKVRQLGGTN